MRRKILFLFTAGLGALSGETPYGEEVALSSYTLEEEGKKGGDDFFLTAEEALRVDSEEMLASVKPKTNFLYVAGGINPLPTVSLGYRTLYRNLGSDLSITISATPLFGKVEPIPGVVYKQLFTKEKWALIPKDESIVYYGLQTGIYPLGALAINGGGLLGWHFKGRNRSDFFEIGVNPLLYVHGNGLRALPLFSITYALMY